MHKLKNRKALEDLRAVCERAYELEKTKILVCGGTGCVAGGSLDIYARIQELAGRFEQKHGSIVCRELLGLSVRRQAPVPEARTAEYYKKRPCAEIIGDAAEILEQYIKENQNESKSP